MRKIIGILVVLSSIYAAGEAIAAESRPGCHVCGMYIDQYQKTAGALDIHRMEKRFNHAASPACSEWSQMPGGRMPLRFNSGHGLDVGAHRLPAEEAVYVLSSKIIPDMLPSIIAFKDRREAEHVYRKNNGGELISFSQALLTISPAAMTMPVRIKTAAVPSKGSSGIGIGYMSMKMDTVKIGSDSADPEDFVQRPGQMMGPKEMKAQSTMLMANYGLSDRLAMGLKAAYVEKKRWTCTPWGAIRSTPLTTAD
jgi:hypothetical protein